MIYLCECISAVLLNRKKSQNPFSIEVLCLCIQIRESFFSTFSCQIPYSSLFSLPSQLHLATGLHSSDALVCHFPFSNLFEGTIIHFIIGTYFSTYIIHRRGCKTKQKKTYIVYTKRVFFPLWTISYLADRNKSHVVVCLCVVESDCCMLGLQWGGRAI